MLAARGARVVARQGALVTRARNCAQAHPRRVARVAKQIEREVGAILLTDKVVLDITRPDAATAGSAVAALVSCTGVEVTNDLQVVKVYVSVYTDDTDAKERTVARLNGLAGYVRSKVGSRVRLRLTPEVRFIQDDSYMRSERVLRLLDRADKERRGELEPLPFDFSALDRERANDAAERAAAGRAAGGDDVDKDEGEGVDDFDDEGFFVLDEEEEQEEGEEEVRGRGGSAGEGDVVAEEASGRDAAAAEGSSSPDVSEGVVATASVEGAGGARAGRVSRYRERQLAKQSGNRFLEGVDEEEEDDDDEDKESAFFTADMFPDAHPELDAAEAWKRAADWKARQVGRGKTSASRIIKSTKY